MIVNETTVRHMFTEINVSNLISTKSALFISSGAICNLLILSSLTKIFLRNFWKHVIFVRFVKLGQLLFSYNS